MRSVTLLSMLKFDKDDSEFNLQVLQRDMIPCDDNDWNSSIATSVKEAIIEVLEMEEIGGEVTVDDIY